MCKIVEDIVAEEIAEEKYRIAVRLINTEYPLEKVAAVLNLPLETVKELAEKYKEKSA